MSVFSFKNYTPPARFDDVPWTVARVQQADAPSGSWAQIDALTLDPVDGDPANPQVRNLTTSLASNTPQKWYRIVWADASAGTSLPTDPIQDFGLTVQPFTTATELFRILKIKTPTSDQTAAADRVLLVAANEIMAEIDLVDPGDLSESDVALCASVNLDRAADLWRHTESAPGILGVVDEAVPSTFGRYSWERYGQRLATVKQQWGIA
jgi:hypothetical protein